MYAHIACTDTVIKPLFNIVFHILVSFHTFLFFFLLFLSLVCWLFFFSVGVDGLKGTALFPMHFFLYTPQKYATVI